MTFRIIAALIIFIGFVTLVGAVIGMLPKGNHIGVDDIAPLCLPVITIGVGSILWLLTKPKS